MFKTLQHGLLGFVIGLAPSLPVKSELWKPSPNVSNSIWQLSWKLGSAHGN
jgi:hypothetical protein